MILEVLVLLCMQLDAGIRQVPKILVVMGVRTILKVLSTQWDVDRMQSDVGFKKLPKIRVILKLLVIQSVLGMRVRGNSLHVGSIRVLMVLDALKIL